MSESNETWNEVVEQKSQSAAWREWIRWSNHWGRMVESFRDGRTVAPHVPLWRIYVHCCRKTKKKIQQGPLPASTPPPSTLLCWDEAIFASAPRTGFLSVAKLTCRELQIFTYLSGKTVCSQRSSRININSQISQMQSSECDHGPFYLVANAVFVQFVPKGKKMNLQSFYYKQVHRCLTLADKLHLCSY